MGKVRLGLIGLGGQMRGHYIPYLEDRRARQGDVEVAWISGYLESDAGHAQPLQARGYRCQVGEHAWRGLLGGDEIDGVVISLPNGLHADPICQSLELGLHVAVDKPPTVSSEQCVRLADLADVRGLVFATLSQRRYEDVYTTVADRVARGHLGDPVLINYTIVHEDYDAGRATWRQRRSLAGGGALIDSGYHGIDTILWLIARCRPAVWAESVSARWVRRIPPGAAAEGAAEAVESVAAARIALSNGGIFNVVASHEGPEGSLDEDIKIFGTLGTVRIIRDRLARTRADMSAAALSWQHHQGTYLEYDTRGWQGTRWAPLADFLDTVVIRKEGRPGQVGCPARDSVQTVRLIERAYASAEGDGQEIRL